MDSLQKYFSGEILIGDNYTDNEIEDWFDGEREGYANLGAKDYSNYSYGYHELNKMHGYSHLPAGKKLQVLAYGAAYGEELLPLKNSLAQVVILDPSDSFEVSNSPIPFVEWKKPNALGHLSFDDEAFDLTTCFGVLHHIPNVSFVIGEIYRVTKIGGMVLLREPITSMGDWTKARIGLTKCERGIPKKILLDICIKAGFIIRSKHLCMFPPLSKLLKILGLQYSVYNCKTLVVIDHILSKIFSFNASKYHRVGLLSKFAPSNYFLVLEKK